MSFSPTISPFPFIPTQNPRKAPVLPHSSPNSNPNDPNNDSNSNPNPCKLLQLSVTLTIVSSSLLQARIAQAKVAEKKPKVKRASEAVSPEELKNWSKGLPEVSDRIPYTEVVRLGEEGRIKHIVKLQGVALRQRAGPVLVVLDDNRVLKSVVPSFERDERFWECWDRLKMDSLCINAYSPGVRRPEVPKAFLGWMGAVPSYLFKLVKPKAKSKRAIEIENARKEFADRKRVELARVRKEREAVEKVLKAQRKVEMRKRRAEMKKERYEKALRKAMRDNEEMSTFWKDLANNQNVSTALGLLIFYLFYRVVVLNYRQQQKDYEDRRKIEKAEAEERRKLKQMEREMGFEVPDEEEEQGGEQNPYMKTAMQFMKSGARVRRARSGKVPQYLERGVDVKFSDVAGLGNIRMELEEIVKFFTLGEMYRRRGVKIPGGILLCGPPGVGKTLLAKAVAGEAGVNFFSISASQFVEIYVGVGASRVRALYQEAKENAPAVVFIDELDAVGRERGLIKGSGGQERDATLNQLLVCLDGFEGRGDVITIAATNRPDILDPALVRPGRFDRKIYIPKPSLIGRVEILKVHARKKPMAEDVDFMAVASMTDGMVGAELANIIEIAAINMMRDGRSEITTDDLIQAAQIEERGMLDKKEKSPEMWKRLALNEAAMAVVAANFPDMKNIEFVTISPRAGRELGYVRVKMDHLKFTEGMLSRQSLLDHITVQTAPRAADEIWYGENQLSTIWAETADNARSAARSFVLGGLSEKYHGLSDFWDVDRIDDIDLEALRILENCYARAKQILNHNKELMDAIVNLLIEKRSLTKQEFHELVREHGHLERLPDSIVNIRKAKQLQFQELMTSHNESTHKSFI